MINFSLFFIYYCFEFKDQSESEDLMQVAVKILDTKECSMYEFFDNESQICAGDLNQQNDACEVIQRRF